jgi:YegS/Rv2252/BmrU family lipid kinase
VNTLVVLNPAAGRGKCARNRNRVEHGLRDAGVDYELVETTGPGHAIGLARDAATNGFSRLICVGGDGTVHEAVNGLLQAPLAEDGATQIALGCIPLGTGDDFAKLLNTYKLPPEAAAARMARAEVKRFDVGCADGEYFANVLGMGFDAEVVRNSNKMRRLKGIAVYLAAIYRTFVTFRAPVLEVESAEHCEVSAMMMLAVQNGISEGGGFYLTPESDPADGFLDVCVIRKVGLLKFLRYVPLVMKGTHVGLDEVTIFRTRRLVVRSKDRPLVLESDGELREPASRELHVSVEPGKLRVLVGR